MCDLPFLSINFCCLSFFLFCFSFTSNKARLSLSLFKKDSKIISLLVD
jgi:hypothetical protein